LINYPIQGSAADLIKKAMLAVHGEVVEKRDDCKLLLQIHDDLVFEVKDDKKIIAEVVEQVQKIMTTVYPLDVPIEVDVKIGKNWGEMVQIGKDHNFTTV
jgi:DNA polymerase-1